MITELFLGRLAARDPHQRVQVIGPLARAFLCPDLSAVSREEIGAGFAAILTDPNPIVRRALAEALADSPDAPHHLVAALAFDQLAVSAPVLRRSPVLQDHDLVELIGEGVAQTQMLIAGRSRISPPVAAALIELGLQPGQTGAIMASSRIEHVLSDLAILHAVAVSAVKELADHGVDKLQVELLLDMLDVARDRDNPNPEASGF